jgi:hypothetical protein
VLADVSGSYRQAIISTVAHWGITITREDIDQFKAKGNANNDWVVSLRMMEERWDTTSTLKRPTLSEVTSKFEELYQGTPSTPGLCSTVCFP